MNTPPSQMPVSEARDILGTLVDQVATTGARVRLTHYGKPAGALISLGDNQHHLQMPLGGAHGVTDAITNWTRVRQSARTHPQALVLPSRGIAVLLGPELEHRLDHGHPPLPDGLTFDGMTITGSDGNPIPPGTYTAGNQVVTLGADEVP